MQHELLSFHYGETGRSEKIYLQASLHADELPGMLVLHHLKRLLAQAELRGDLLGEVVVIPVANPIGLSQRLLYDQLGRFDANSGENFNRRYPDFVALIGQDVAKRLNANADANKRAIRQMMIDSLARQAPTTELDSLRRTLVRLAVDADVVLDLHCDNEAVVHMYTEAPYLEQATPLFRYLEAEAVLIARGSGAASFDEALSGPWWQLAELHGPTYPIPLACLSATVELRGKSDVYHEQASVDAARLFAFMQHRGVIAGTPPALPTARCEPTPLAGSETLRAPHAGVIAYFKNVGTMVAAGEVVAEIIDPLSEKVTQVAASVAGCFFARENRRYAVRGMDIGKIAGKIPFRSGNLLGA
jgi:predicted deacylase